MVAQICDIFNTIINTLFREVPESIKAILIIVFLLVSLLCLAKTIRLGGNKMPINIGFFLLFILFFTLSMLYIWL